MGIWAFSANARRIPWNKSQLDVCGATIRIYFAFWGNFPDAFQPSIFKRTREIPRKNDFTTGVLKIV
jgi:hypothetical protein